MGARSAGRSRRSGAVLEPSSLRIGSTRRVRVAGVLQPAGSFRRCQLLELPRPAAGGLVRVRVRGGALGDDGIRDGDQIVLDPRREAVRAGRTVLADVDGCAVLGRVAGGHAEGVRLEPTVEGALPLGRARADAVHGVVVGILRKRGFEPGERAAPAPAPAEVAPGSAPQRLQNLRACLRAVAATYRTTAHPRLRRALRDEARLLVRELEREQGRRAS